MGVIYAVTRFGFALAYKSLSSKSAKDFMEKFRQGVPFKIRGIQTMGEGFAGEFEKYNILKPHNLLGRLPP